MNEGGQEKERKGQREKGRKGEKGNGKTYTQYPNSNLRILAKVKNSDATREEYRFIEVKE